VRVLNNIFSGTGTSLTGGDVQNNHWRPETPASAIGRTSTTVSCRATAIDAGAVTGPANDMSLTRRTGMSTSKGEARPSVGRVDIGALEYGEARLSPGASQRSRMARSSTS